MKRSTAEQYVARLGEEFLAELLDASIPRMTIAEKYGIARSTLSVISQHYGIIRQRRYKKTKAYFADIDAWLPAKDIAAKHGIGIETVTGDRARRHGPTKRYVRLDTSKVSLLKSSLPLDAVARAIGTSKQTAYTYRRDIQPGYMPRKRAKYKLTDEDRALILSYPTTKEAEAALPFGKTVVKRVFTTEAIRNGTKKNAGKPRRTYPDDPAWWAARNLSQAARDLGAPLTSVAYHVMTRGITTKHR